jgi:hypothetical protein
LSDILRLFAAYPLEEDRIADCREALSASGVSLESVVAE